MAIRITGTIVKSDVKADDKTKRYGAGDQDRICRGDIDPMGCGSVAIVAGEPLLHLELKDGQTVVGPVTTVDPGKLDVATATTGEVAAPKDTRCCGA